MIISVTGPLLIGENGTTWLPWAVTDIVTSNNIHRHTAHIIFFLVKHFFISILYKQGQYTGQKYIVDLHYLLICHQT